MFDLLRHPVRLIWAGFVMLFIGWLVPLLTVIKVIRPHLVLLLGSYGVALFGFAVGLIGIYTHSPRSRGR